MVTHLFNEAPTRKNFLVINCLNGFIEVAHDAKTDEEIDSSLNEETISYFDAVSMSLLDVGESFTLTDGSCIVVRVS